MPASFASDHFTNFGISSVYGGAAGAGTNLLATDTSMSLAPGDGAKFPSQAPFNLTLGGDTDTPEIVRVTNIIDDQITSMIRGYDNTAARAWVLGTLLQHTITAQTMTHIWDGLSGIHRNVKDYGAVGDGVVDDTVAIQAALDDGPGIVYLPPGNYLFSDQLVFNSDNLALVGAGIGQSILTMASVFNQSTFGGHGAIFIYGHSYCRVANLTLTGPTTTTSSNPSVSGLDFSSNSGVVADHWSVEHVECRYINGDALHSWDSSYIYLNDIQTYSCKQGVQIEGDSNRGSYVSGRLSNLYLDKCTDGSSLLLNNCVAVYVDNLVVINSQATANCVGVSLWGTVNAHITNFHIDTYTTNGAAKQIECIISNTTPRDVFFVNGRVEGGISGVEISGGQHCQFQNVHFVYANTYGAHIVGSANNITFSNCVFYQNGSQGTSGRYDVSHESSGRIKLVNCSFATPIGTGAFQVNKNINYTATGAIQVLDCTFLGAGVNATTAVNGGPFVTGSVIRNNLNYDPTVYNIRSFGARGDGVTDDGPALRAALSAIQSAGGGMLYLPAGTYYCSTASNPEDSNYPACGFIPGNTLIRGEGSGKTVIRLANNSPDRSRVLINWHIATGGDEQIRLEDLTLDGNAPNQTMTAGTAGYGFTLMRTRNVYCSRVKFVGVYGTTNSGGGEGFHATFDLSTNGVFEACECSGGTNTATGFSANQSTNIVYVACIGRNMGAGHGFTIYDCAGVRYDNCIAYQNGTAGFNAENSVDVRYTACRSGGAIVDNGSWPYSAGQLIGNTGNGFTINNTVNVTLSGCLSNRNGSNGLQILSVASGAGVIQVIGGEFSNNGVDGISGGFSDVLRVYNGTVMVGNTTSPMRSASIDHGTTGSMTAAAIPASGTALANPYSIPCAVTISGGTVTAIAINGVTVAGTSGTFYLQPGNTITLTYSVAPTWTWVGML